jgi:hypothetical protein
MPSTAQHGPPERANGCTRREERQWRPIRQAVGEQAPATSCGRERKGAAQSSPITRSRAARIKLSVGGLKALLSPKFLLRLDAHY